MAKRARKVSVRPYLVELLTNLTEPQQLFYELVQNADDDADATEISFTFSPSDLTVWNDGKFSRCTNFDDVSLSCNFGDGSAKGNRSCDFHRLEEIQNAEKSKEEDTTGAFGIGFNAVFIVSDKPELISSGVHLSFYNDESDPGMDTCEERECMRGCGDSPGTKLILPWATEEGSKGRNFYEQPAITPTDFARYQEAAVASAPMALLFNRNLKKISVKNRDGTIHQWTKTVDSQTIDGETVTISSSDSRQRWRKFHHDLSKDSSFLTRHRHTLDENGANKALSIAVQEDAEETTRAGGRQVGGRLFVTFPTEVETHLPVHVHAKFQPERNRQRLKLGGDLGKWNKDLVTQAGRAIAGEIVAIRDALGSPMLFWELVNSAWVAKQGGLDDLGIANYWDASLKEVLKSQKVIWAESDSWMAVDDVRYRLLDKDDKKSNQRVIDVLGKLGVETVHRQIQQEIEQTSGVPILKELGVKELSLTDVAAALRRSDLSRGIDQFLGGKHLLRALWGECDRLLKGQKGVPIQPLALWPTISGSYKPAKDMFRADDDYPIRRIVEGFRLDVEFLDDAMPSSFKELREVVNSFQLEHLVDALAASINSNANKLTQVDDKQRKRLFKWIYDHKEDLEDDSKLRDRLASLPLYPTKQGPRSLKAAYWPTGFKDRLGIVETINTDALSKTDKELLDLLGVKKLTFETYCTESLPNAFRDGKVKSGQQRDLVEELAVRLDAIAESPQVLDALKGLPLIECAGDEPRFLEAGKAYFDSEEVKGVLGSQAVLAVVNGGTHDLLNLLGVSDKPRLADVVEAIRALGQKAVEENKSQVIKTIDFLSAGWPMKRDDPEDDFEARMDAFTRPLEPLRALAWLPGSKGTAWKCPKDLAARVNQHLFEDQAVFLDINKDKQANARAKALLDWLGLRIDPEPNQVVAQLSYCATSHKRVDWRVYAYLDDQAKSRDDDLLSGPHLDEVFEPLQGRPCLLVEEEGESGIAFEYLAPHKVFMSPPPFGRYRSQLPLKFKEYPHLLVELGVKESPDAEDAQRLLRELSTDADDAPLDDHDKTVIKSCWEIFENQLCEAEERELEEIPNEVDLLRELIRQIGQRKSFFNQASIPTRPDGLVLNDSHRRASYLTGQSREPLVEREGPWKALQVAGAKKLSTDLRFEIVEEHLLEDDIPFEKHLEERWGLIERVVYDQGDDTARERLQELGPRVEVRSSTTLSAKLRIHKTALNQSHPVQIKAFFDNVSKELLRKLDVPTPWTDIVSELFASLALEKGANLYIESVLQTETVQEAERFLEVHDVPRLPETERHEYLSEMPTAGRTVDAQGVSEDAAPDSDDHSSAETEVPATLGVETDVSTDADSEFEDEEDDDRRLDPETDLDFGEESSDRWGRGDEEFVYPDDDEAVSDDHQGHEPSRGSNQRLTETSVDRRRRPSRDPSRSPARTNSEGSHTEEPSSARGSSRFPPAARYTIRVGRSGESGLSDEEGKQIGAEGESAVIEYEEAAGRFPADMNDPDVVGGYHNHVGWDIESRSSSDGEVERFIEVKARRGKWVPNDISLSALQLEQAREHRERYWLYVVEYLGTDDQKIHPIRDPYHLLQGFYFGPEFRAHAEYSEDGP